MALNTTALAGSNLNNMEKPASVVSPPVGALSTQGPHAPDVATDAEGPTTLAELALYAQRMKAETEKRIEALLETLQHQRQTGLEVTDSEEGKEKQQQEQQEKQEQQQQQQHQQQQHQQQQQQQEQEQQQQQQQQQQHQQQQQQQSKAAADSKGSIEQQQKQQSDAVGEKLQQQQQQQLPPQQQQQQPQQEQSRGSKEEAGGSKNDEDIKMKAPTPKASPKQRKPLEKATLQPGQKRGRQTEGEVSAARRQKNLTGRGAGQEAAGGEKEAQGTIEGKEKEKEKEKESKMAEDKVEEKSQKKKPTKKQTPAAIKKRKQVKAGTLIVSDQPGQVQYQCCGLSHIRWDDTKEAWVLRYHSKGERLVHRFPPQHYLRKDPAQAQKTKKGSRVGSQAGRKEGGRGGGGGANAKHGTCKTYLQAVNAALQDAIQKRSVLMKAGILSLPRERAANISEVPGVNWSEPRGFWEVHFRAHGVKYFQAFRPKDKTPEALDEARRAAEAKRRDLEKAHDVVPGDKKSKKAPQEVADSFGRQIPKGENLSWQRKQRILQVKCWRNKRELKARLRPKSYDEEGLEDLVTRARQLKKLLLLALQKRPDASHDELVRDARAMLGEPQDK